VALECTGSAAGLASAIRVVRKGGAIVQVGFFMRPTVPVDMDLIVNRELTLTAYAADAES
jgi:Threonine dehydrogenase and related Zn-dependent dehydrogenases